MTSAAGRLEWGSIAAFYADRGGERSGEVDFGVWWYEGERRGPPHRVSWVEETGDVYAFEQWKSQVFLLGNVETRERLDQILEGWAIACGAPGSLGWVREQLESRGMAAR